MGMDNGHITISLRLPTVPLQQLFFFPSVLIAPIAYDSSQAMDQIPAAAMTYTTAFSSNVLMASLPFSLFSIFPPLCSSTHEI